MGYGGSDGNRQKFTGYERDTESGLDYAHARYYANVQGRFTSPDSLMGSIGNPQSLNRYAYVGNNPVNYSDPTGHDRFSASSNGFAETMGQGSNLMPENPSDAAKDSADYDQRLQNTRDVIAANNAIADGNDDLARSIVRNNSAVRALDASGNDRTLAFQNGTVSSAQNQESTSGWPMRFIFPKIAENATNLDGTQANTKMCATWVQQMAEKEGNNPGSANNWYGGEQVMTNSIPAGTIIISGLDANGKYPNRNKYNHAGFFLYYERDGFAMLENVKGHIQIRHVSGNGDYFRGTDQYFVLRVPVAIKSGAGGSRSH